MIFEMVVDYQSAGWGLNTYDGSKMYLKDIHCTKMYFTKNQLTSRMLLYFLHCISFR